MKAKALIITALLSAGLIAAGAFARHRYQYHQYAKERDRRDLRWNRESNRICRAIISDTKGLIAQARDAPGDNSGQMFLFVLGLDAVVDACVGPGYSDKWLHFPTDAGPAQIERVLNSAMASIDRALIANGPLEAPILEASTINLETRR
jgi:hypothetical protein